MDASNYMYGIVLNVFQQMLYGTAPAMLFLAVPNEKQDSDKNGGIVWAPVLRLDPEHCRRFCITGSVDTLPMTNASLLGSLVVSSMPCGRPVVAPVGSARIHI